MVSIVPDHECPMKNAAENTTFYNENLRLLQNLMDIGSTRNLIALAAVNINGSTRTVNEKIRTSANV